MTHHPDDIAAVMTANRDRLMGIAEAVKTLAAPIDLSKKGSRTK